MSVSTATKTAAGVLLALTQQASGAIAVGTAVDVSTKLYGQVFVKVGRAAATALTNEITFRFEASAKTSGNDEWIPIYTCTTTKGKTAAISTTVNDAAFNAGDTSFTVTAGTSIVAGDNLYVRETGTPANSEWVRVLQVSTNLITVEEAVTRTHTNGINVATNAEEISFNVNLLGIARVRLVVDTASAVSGVTCDILAWITTLDSITTV